PRHEPPPPRPAHRSGGPLPPDRGGRLATALPGLAEPGALAVAGFLAGLRTQGVGCVHQNTPHSVGYAGNEKVRLWDGIWEVPAASHATGNVSSPGSSRRRSQTSLRSILTESGASTPTRTFVPSMAMTHTRISSPMVISSPTCRLST